ncbi:MAG: class F sortase [Candidatus Saccharimonadaceae bacterium]
MQQLQSHYRWFQSFRRLRMSAFLAVTLLLFAFTNASLLLLAQAPQNVQAQTTSAVIETSEAPKQAEVAQAAATNTTPVQEPAPQPAPDPAPKPAPAKAAQKAATPAPTYDKVSIPSLGLSSKFVTVGLTSTNAIDVNSSLVGWWNGSAKPGNPGAVFLDGHNPGVFSKLPSVKEGAVISISRASGEVFNYTVVHVETVQLIGIDMVKALAPYGGAKEGLNIMTCVGTYSAKTGTTDQRLVVYAVRS